MGVWLCAESHSEQGLQVMLHSGLFLRLILNRVNILRKIIMVINNNNYIVKRYIIKASQQHTTFSV